MQTECMPDLFGFTPLEGKQVVAGFDGGAITSDAGGLLLRAADRAIDLVGRFAGCFRDARCPWPIEHEVRTLVGQRVFAIALGYEDLIDHDDLRHDPIMSVLVGKLAAKRKDCAPAAGQIDAQSPGAEHVGGDALSQDRPRRESDRKLVRRLFS